MENLIKRRVFAVSDLVFHCLLMSHKKDTRLIWVKDHCLHMSNSTRIKLSAMVHHFLNRREFNNASAFKRSLYWCQALHITNKDRYLSTSAWRALALLNSPLDNICITTRCALLKTMSIKIASGKYAYHSQTQ